MAFRAWSMRLWALLLLGLAVQPAVADQAFTLDGERRAALTALPVIEGPVLADEDLSEKPVIVTFFASWCPPCHAEFAHLRELKAQYGESITIVAVNIFETSYGSDPDGTRLAGFLQRHAPPFRVVSDGEAVKSLFNDVSRIPTVYVFDPRGQQVLSFIHAEGATKTHVTLEELRQALAQALS